jgi:hypothetical protein
MRIFGCVCLLLLLAGICSAQDTNFPVGPQYLMTFGSPLFARPIATPSLSFETPLPENTTTEPSEAEVPPQELQVISDVLEQQGQTYLPFVYYGVPIVNVIEISFREPAGDESSRPDLPASITESGVTAFTDAESLRQRGYGITLSDAAHRWKSSKSTARHRYTNDDLAQLHN